MGRKITRAEQGILIGTYAYLALPMVIFLLGWCRWYIGIPAAAIVIWAVIRCIKENGLLCVVHHRRKFVNRRNRWKALAVLIIVTIWVVLSGVGGYVWQNSDHWWRNTIFDILMDQSWAPVKEMEIDGYIQGRGMVYYIGFWLPAALVGKLFGAEAGYAAQYVWAIIGILLLYAVICLWRRKIQIWPLVLFIFFSGLDVIGVLISQPGEVAIFGELHLEAWAEHYQFSSMTTQLFWVFNQAIPVWLVSILIFLCERPRNMIFVWSLTMLTSTLPFIGLFPYVVYFMIICAKWNTPYGTLKELVGDICHNWCSIQNLLAGGIVGVISAIYLFGNNVALKLITFFDIGTMPGGVIVAKIILLLLLLILIFYGVFWLVKKGWGRALRTILYLAGVVVIIVKISNLSYSDWQSPLFFWMNMTIFVFLEVGVYLLCLFPTVEDKKLFKLTAIWLYIIPLILIGNSCDFCMRASIPGLLLIALWCIDMIGKHKGEMRMYVLIVLLILGAVTPMHEIKRTYINTRGYYENASVEQEVIYSSGNFSGSTDGFFWKYIAKGMDE